MLVAHCAALKSAWPCRQFQRRAAGSCGTSLGPFKGGHQQQRPGGYRAAHQPLFQKGGRYDHGCSVSISAVIESFWGRMQAELFNRKRWKTRIELVNAMLEYLGIFHNRQRRHSDLGMLSPFEFENLCFTRQPVACSQTAPRNSGHIRIFSETVCSLGLGTIWVSGTMIFMRAFINSVTQGARLEW